MAENVRVVVRCRPLNKREKNLKCENIVEINDCNLCLKNPHDAQAAMKNFTYDVVYNESTTTEIIYNDVCYGLVDSVLEGYNATIFAYGQTGCGKTHTMQGPEELSLLSSVEMTPEMSDQRGIIARTFEHIFEAISLAKEQRFLILISYLEIYNETIRDLLADNNNNNNNHILKEIPGVGVVVPTLSTHTVHNVNECFDLLNIGNKQRAQAATLMNAQSSRSHTIFTLSIEQIQQQNDNNKNNNVVVEDLLLHEEEEEEAEELKQQPHNEKKSGGVIRRGKLNLVDLAGSERQQKTGAAGERLREATKINLSLSALGNVISALVDGKTKHIPYRDSKLTRLLQDSLGGNTKTLMIACISPADNNYDETISTLRYASRAKNIANKPRINEDPKDAKLREYQEEIVKLKKLLDESQQQQHHHQQSQQLQQPQSQRQQQAQQQLQPQQQFEEHVNNIGNDVELISNNSKNYEMYNNGSNIDSNNQNHEKILQLEALQRIEHIKKALIGGERASDKKLYEKRQHRKMASQRRLSALAQALSRVHESEDRDLLQIHYTSIQQELYVKNEYLKRYRQKIKALEQEVNDLQSEFQLDRADYLDSIRKLERNYKFQQQIMECALPILRKAGKYWDLDEILQSSQWNDDLKVWKLPESMLNNFKLPLTTSNKNNNNIHNMILNVSNNNSNFSKPTTAATTTIVKNIKSRSGIGAGGAGGGRGGGGGNYFDEAVLSATNALKTRSANKSIIIEEEEEEEKDDREKIDNHKEDIQEHNDNDNSCFRKSNDEHLRNYFLKTQKQRSKTATATTSLITSTTTAIPNLNNELMSREDVLRRWRDFAERQVHLNRQEQQYQ